MFTLPIKRMRFTISAKLITALLAVLVPLSVMTLLLNRQGSGTIYEEISKSVQSRDAFYIQSLENALKGISQLMFEFVIDKELMEIGISEEPITSFERMNQVLVIQKRLHMLKASSTYIAEAKVFLPFSGRTIASDDYLSEIPPDEYAKLADNVDPSRVMAIGDRLFMSMRFPLSASGRKPVFIVVVELSADKLRESLQNIVNPDQGDSILFHIDENWEITNERDEEFARTMRTFAERQLQGDAAIGMVPTVLESAPYLVSYRKSDVLNTVLLVYVPEGNILGSLHRYERWIWVLLGFSLCIAFLLSISIYRIIHHPLRRLVVAFRKVEDGKLLPVEVGARRDEFQYLYHRFNSMVARLDALISEVYKKEILSQRSELKRLQSQINPHFMYNCLFSLNRLIQEGANERAYRFTLYLGEYFRFITRNADDRIPLREEMKHAQVFVGMQSIIYGDCIDVEFEPLADAYGDLLVPRQIVQPILENAYKYALGPLVLKGELWVHTSESDGYFSVWIEDNGEELTDARLAELASKLLGSGDFMEETTGVINVHRRIELMFGSGSGLSLTRSQLGGLCVEIRLKQDGSGKAETDVSNADRG
ncbi:MULTISPECIES: sensor histidine kinase [Cohnella]|uniref:Two-component system sensor histidine kinase YesM n=1 Tax=Cohnella phaseoli TaxID=456490 RepID=A0A3D9IS14_9BACL|nr:histidine kinase [Cohnella phaseoli]RED64468.1 two-component system sensor histidine kinase YesM [Cohnella phaseoli]